MEAIQLGNNYGGKEVRMLQPLDDHIKNQLNKYIADISEQWGNADTMAIYGPIISDVDRRVRNAIEMNSTKAQNLAIILQTLGGYIEVVERIVEIIRHFYYKEVIIIVPDQAMSAGTVFALSADKIMMDYFSRLGPIDPQIFKDGKWIPALSYIKQYEKLNKKSADDNLTTVEYAMLQQIDVAELYQFKQARELSVELLEKWLSQYKFKDWQETESKKEKVTRERKKIRAKQIADSLNDPDKWHSHGRGISIDTLRTELNLKIEDYGENKELADKIKVYFDLLTNYLTRHNINSFVHTKEYF